MNEEDTDKEDEEMNEYDLESQESCLLYTSPSPRD